jgi:hypothetical protein
VIGKFPSPIRRPSGLTWDGKTFWAIDAFNVYIQFDQTGRTYASFLLPNTNDIGYGLAWVSPLSSLATGVATARFRPADETFFNTMGWQTQPAWPQQGGGSAFDGTTLYVFDNFSQSLGEYDPTTGTMTGGGSVTGLQLLDAVYDLAFDGAYIWACGHNLNTNTDFLYRIDPNSLSVNLQPAAPSGIGGLTFDGTTLWAAGPGVLYQLAH